jgi:hypothetical protein
LKYITLVTITHGLRSITDVTNQTIMNSKGFFLICIVGLGKTSVMNYKALITLLYDYTQQRINNISTVGIVLLMWVLCLMRCQLFLGSKALVYTHELTSIEITTIQDKMYL